MEKQEIMIKHLEMIQGIISRMAANSFLLKGWSVTLVSAMFALSQSQKDIQIFILMALIPTVIFWILDAFYLRQERLFRFLYDDVRKLETITDFSMDTSKHQDKPSIKYHNVLFSNTLLQFYGSMIITIGLVWLYFFMSIAEKTSK